MFTGFLEGGKTRFMQETLEDVRAFRPAHVLLPRRPL